MQRGSIAAAAIASIALATPTIASADPEGGVVSGVVELPAHADRKPLPIRSRGFTKRIRGPLKEPTKHNPRDELVVFLDGGPVADADKKPSKDAVRYQLIGESFISRLFPFVVGSPVEVKNTGHASPRLYAVGADGAIEEAPVSTGGVRPIKAPTEPFKTLEIRDRESAHTSGVLLALPHAYFSLVSEDGKYEIKGVPAGTWTVKVWYGNGWVAAPTPVTVSVTANRPAKAPTFQLPSDLAVGPESPTSDGDAEEGD